MSKPVVFVPGVPGTILELAATGSKVFPPSIFDLLIPPMDPTLKARLQGPDDLSETDPIRAGDPIASTKLLGFDLMKQAKSLYEILASCGIEDDSLEKVGWDWRRPITETGPDSAQERLAAAIDRLAVSHPGTGITLVVHSTGGLLARHFLEANPSHAEKVERVIAFGVPWAGLLKSLQVLTAKHAFPLMSRAETRDVLCKSWAAYDLLPRANGADLVVDEMGNPVNPLTSLEWVQRVPAALRSAVTERAAHSMAHLGTPASIWNLEIPVVNLVGWGWKTTVAATLDRSSGAIQFNQGLTGEQPNQGDGTVPFVSASWLSGPRVRTLQIPIGAYPRSGGSKKKHSSLWRNPGGRAILKHLLAGLPLDDFTWATVDWSDKVDPAASQVRLRFVAQELDGQPQAGAFARLVQTAGPAPPDAPISPSGRGFLKVHRSHLRKTIGGRFRRLVVELHRTSHTDPRRFAFLIEP